MRRIYYGDAKMYQLNDSHHNTEAVVSTAHPAALAAAKRILLLGGSAVDAAIAADAVLGVVEPMATGIGGDVLALVYEPETKLVVSYNGTGKSPMGLDASLSSRFTDGKMPERDPLSVTVPGAVRGWHDLYQRYGRLSWAELLKDAIKCARDGYVLGNVAAREWRIFDFVLHKDPECARVFRAGNPPIGGSLLTNPDLANVLIQIADEGSDSFYSGWIPEHAAKTVQSHGGVLGVSDFSQHRGFFTEPVKQEFYGYEVNQCPPNTHGVSILHALKNIQDSHLKPNTAETWLAMVQAAERALAFAKETVTDPGGNTVCTVIADSNGLVINLMSSIFKRFGSGIVVPGGGFCLQNRGFGFDVPGKINGMGPARRPYHTVVPGITTKDGDFHMAMGVVGGLMQPQGQIQIITRVLAWNQDLQESLDAPRWRLEGDKHLAIEPGWPIEIEDYLRESGYIKPARGVGELAGRSDFGGAHALLSTKENGIIGAADKRKDGAWEKIFLN